MTEHFDVARFFLALIVFIIGPLAMIWVADLMAPRGHVSDYEYRGRD